MPQPSGFVIYRGPSLLDGAPIVAIAVTASGNRKTGDMVQTYILCADVAPIEAARFGADASVCGDCKHRPALGGACYVNLGHGPRSVHAAYKRGRYPDATGETLAELGRGRMVRLGTYGDPMAVPAHVWQTLTLHAAGHTGYSHQWQNPRIPAAQWRAVMDLCMASTDSETECVQARDAGLRYFRIAELGAVPGPREFTCPASAEAGKRLTCAQCGACNGTRSAADRRASPVIIVHGAKASRFATTPR